MKTVILTIVITALSFGSSLASSDSVYKTAMQQTIAQYENVKTLSDYQAIVNKFERIASAEENEWLPNYYAGLTYVYMSFVKGLEDDARDEYLDKAEEQIEKAREKAGDNVELVVLEGYVQMASVSVSPAIRGVYKSAKVSGLFEKALAIDNENPRAILMSARWKMGMASFFGQDTAQYCAQIESAIPLFESEDLGDIAPHWGHGQAKSMLKQCK